MSSAPAAPSDRVAHPPSRELVTIFYAVLVFWMLTPFFVRSTLAQDALPFVVAGDLAREHPDDIYTLNGDLFTPPPRFFDRACELSPPGTDCANVTVSFVSPPIALPFAIAIAPLGGENGVLVFRLIAAGSLALGMHVLWRRIAGRTPRASGVLLATTVLLTPFVMVPLVLGQNAPLMFLAACLGIDAATRWKRATAVGAVVALTVMFKFSPAIVLLVALRQRRWKVIIATAGFGVALVAITAALVPFSLYSTFSSATGALPRTALGNPYNGAVDAAIHSVFSAVGSPGDAATIVLLVLKLALAGFGLWRIDRHADGDTEWAYAWVVLMLFLPMVWWHYLFVTIPALAFAAMRSRDPDRSLLALPLAAAIGIPISIINQGSAVPWAQALYLVAVVVAVPWLVTTDRSSQSAGSAPAPSVP